MADPEQAGSGERPLAGVPLVPEGWQRVPGLVAGFGSRSARPPAGTLLPRTQVHGIAVVDADRFDREPAADAADGLPRIACDADALFTASAGRVVGVRTADCVPLLLVAPRHHWAAAVHAGWKGTLAGIAREAVAAAATAGIPAAELLAALGPSIGPCCYEVSVELGESFAAAGLPVARPASGARRPHLDLRDANRVLLERAGLAAAAIRQVGPCTRCAADRYHSFRAEPEAAGRQVSWVGWAAPADRRPLRDP